MKKTVLMSAAKKARIALAVMAVFGFTLAGVQSAFAEIHISGNDNTYTDAKDFSTIVGSKNKLTGKDYDGEITKFTVLGSENSVNAFYEYVLSEDLAKKNQITVVGTKNNIKGTGNTVVGDNNTVNSNESIVLGQNNSLSPYSLHIDSGKNILIGNNIKAQINGSNIAVGNQMDLSASTNTIVIGNKSRIVGAANTVVLGNDAVSSYYRSVLVGNNTRAHSDSVALGYTSVASKAYSEALGAYTRTEEQCSVALGYGSLADDEKTVSVGNNKKRTITNSNGYTTTIPEIYRRIVNMADGKNNHDAATFGQILKTKAYDITIDGTTGKGEVTLETNGGTVAGPTLRFDASALDTQIKKNASDITAVDGKIGSLSADGTYIKQARNVSDNLVALDKQVKVNADAIGTLTSLTTTEKGNLVGAVNEVKGTADSALAQANTNKTSIGTLTNLTTTEKGNLVGAVNEVKGTADAAKTTADSALAQATTNKASIGTLTNLTTTEKTNLVGAVNEIKGTADSALAQANTNTTAIAGKADLGLSNINAAGETVIKNLAKTEAGAIVNVQLGDLSTEKYYVDAGKKVNENISALDKQVKSNADSITVKADQDLSNINPTGENKIKTIAGVVVDGKLGTLTSSNYVDAANTVNANISALDTQVKTNTDAIGSLSADGTYIKQANNVSANLVELDKQVNTNTTAIADKADKNLSNITDAGKNVIKDLASVKAGEVVADKLGTITSNNYVNAGNTVNANISALDTQLNKVDNRIGTMTDGAYISAGNTVAGNLSALDAQLKNNTDAIADKADKNLSNITDAGKNVIKDLASVKAGEVVADKLGTITSNNYVSAGNTVNANISKLDEQVKANADAINTKADKDLSNITDAGKNVIKDLASVKAGEIVDAKLGDITSNNYVNAGNTVNANISALDKQMKVNTDNIGDTSKLTTAGLGSNLSEAVVNVNNKVGTADELKALKDAGLGDNLAQATAAVNKKADKNAEAIKTVNGRVDELGGRVDILGGAVAKLDSRVNKVGAGAAALAALHPMEFDSDNKLSFAAGVGNYRGTNAAAIGAFYRPSEQVMFSISGNMGNGENMVNAGVSFALDRPSKTPTTKAALVKTVVAQNEQIAALNETLAEQSNALEAQSKEIAELKAMVQKLAAKQNA